MDDDNFISFYDFYNKMIFNVVCVPLSLVDSLAKSNYLRKNISLLCVFLNYNMQIYSIVTWEVVSKFIEYFDEIGFYGVTILMPLIIILIFALNIALNTLQDSSM